MKGIKAYIESGVLELYVLGLLGQAACEEVEAMAEEHSEVNAELAAIERSVELFAGENAVKPSETLRSRVLNSLLINLADDYNFPTKTHQALPLPDNEGGEEPKRRKDTGK